MIEKISNRISRHAMIAPGDRVGVAVSGGADSVALVHGLRELFPDTELSVVHFNHCLRGDESDADEQFVRDLADKLGLRFFTQRRDVGLLAKQQRANLEGVARDCRYQFFAALKESGAYDKIATGHTRSDQAETVLFRLLRGTVGPGLSAVRPVKDGSIIRPMLDVSREEVMAFLTAREISWREDSSNQDPSFARNRIRHELLPALQSGWNPNIEQSLANAADWYLEEQRFWDARLASLTANCTATDGDALIVELAAIESLLPAEQRRVIAALLARRQPAAVSFEHIERVRGLVRSESGAGGVDLPGLRVERSFEAIRISRAPEPTSDFDVTLTVPGETGLPADPATRVETRVCGSSEIKERYNTTDWAFLDWDHVPKPLRLRNWRPGDRYRPVGRASEKKLKHLFQEDRIHSWKRSQWPLITASTGGERQETIVWARTFGPAAEFAADSTSRNLLSIHEIKDAEKEIGIEPLP